MHGTNMKIIIVSVLMFRIFTEDKGRMHNDTNKYQMNDDTVKNSYTLQVARTCVTTSKGVAKLKKYCNDRGCSFEKSHGIFTIYNFTF